MSELKLSELLLKVDDEFLYHLKHNVDGEVTRRIKRDQNEIETNS